MSNQHHSNNESADFDDYLICFLLSANSVYSSLDKDFIYRDILTTDQNIKNDSSEPLKGIVLYTDIDREIINYTRDNFQEFDKLTGDWIEIYILEKPHPNPDSLRKYWKSIFHLELYEKIPLTRWFLTTKPFNRNESYRKIVV
ncbi:MAG: hypothetical protein F6K24_45245 [Okeania sp. SIO2D1]|uniref:hypothetical protein n=1 Tax=Okeania sp. SIO2C9 TaxID=2607791 RepID=UPI0013BD7E30|nr:hypothetical protein [Okeania sp. SIO2C9]NEQ76875.1 hypothetical protein [Okeania sp. SIO2C9]NES71906.1 hypothetical protein [Okeania sp. SIO2D1]